MKSKSRGKTSRTSVREELERFLETHPLGEFRLTIALPADRSAHVVIVVRRTVGSAHDRDALRARALEELRACPWRADRCPADTNQRGFTFSGRRQCPNFPTVAVELNHGITFLCASHAAQHVDRRTMAMFSQDMSDARRRAELERTKIAKREQAVDDELERKLDDSSAPPHTSTPSHGGAL